MQTHAGFILRAFPLLGPNVTPGATFCADFMLGVTCFYKPWS